MNTNETPTTVKTEPNPTQSQSAPEAQPAPEQKPISRPEPKIIEIPEHTEFFVEGQKVTVPRINGVRSAKITGLNQKIITTGTKTFKRLVIKLSLNDSQPGGQLSTTEYECPLSWKPESDLQSITATILGRPLTPEEVRASKFDINQLRGKLCNIYAQEYRSKSGSRSLIVVSFQPMETVVTTEAIAA